MISSWIPVGSLHRHGLVSCRTFFCATCFSMTTSSFLEILKFRTCPYTHYQRGDVAKNIQPSRYQMLVRAGRVCRIWSYELSLVVTSWDSILRASCDTICWYLLTLVNLHHFLHHCLHLQFAWVSKRLKIPVTVVLLTLADHWPSLFVTNISDFQTHAKCHQTAWLGRRFILRGKPQCPRCDPSGHPQNEENRFSWNPV